MTERAEGVGCTCGTGLRSRRGHHDVTGSCGRGGHGHVACSGRLAAATGSHWWCACTCHSEPDRPPLIHISDVDVDRALNTWRRARDLAEHPTP